MSHKQSTRTPRVIKSAAEYEAVLNDVETLVASDPAKDSPDADHLELLSLLVRDYEANQFSFEAVDPVDAIEFRMAEQGLRQKDLAPILGNKSRVSEVLARKRPLTLEMIRSLHHTLHIPLQILVQSDVVRKAGSQDASQADDRFDWQEFPIQEMKKRGYFDAIEQEPLDDARALVVKFLARVTGKLDAVPALFRRTFRGEGVKPAPRYSLIAWTAQVLIRAKAIEHEAAAYQASAIDAKFLRDIARLSLLDSGPKLATDLLRTHGIILIIERALPSTLVDGAAMKLESGRPVIGMTLRQDRIDNFWFTLLHEIAHIKHHLTLTTEAFVDRTDDATGHDEVEQEANQIARDALIPRTHWRSSVAAASPTKRSIIALAQEVGVHPAIVAGRVQFESRKYDRFHDLVGRGEVRKHFGSAFSTR